MSVLLTVPARGRQRGASTLPALLGIAAIVVGLALAFAWTAGWLTPERLTPQRFTTTLEQANGKVYPGARRAHAKGVCVSGHFQSSGAGAAYSTAAVLAAGAQTPVLGRLSIGGGMPAGSDAAGRVRSLAILLKTPDGQEWRTAMNSFPVFMARDAAGFYALNVASTADPATGKPDPAKMAAFKAGHPEAKAFFDWAGSAPWESSWANSTYNGVDSFHFVDAGGQRHAVRWSMRPTADFEALTPEQLKTVDPDFLAKDLDTRLAAGPLQWTWVATLAGPGDAVDDPTVAWPEDRQQVVLGTLSLDHAEPQATGACRDLNFDPLILPTGVEGSDDPILAARSAVYSVSFGRREHETAAGAKP